MNRNKILGALVGTVGLFGIISLAAAHVVVKPAFTFGVTNFNPSGRTNRTEVVGRSFSDGTPIVKT